jgi:hypothetical protein
MASERGCPQPRQRSFPKWYGIELHHDSISEYLSLHGLLAWLVIDLMRIIRR